MLAAAKYAKAIEDERDGGTEWRPHRMIDILTALTPYEVRISEFANDESGTFVAFRGQLGRRAYAMFTHHQGAPRVDIFWTTAGNGTQLHSLESDSNNRFNNMAVDATVQSIGMAVRDGAF